jgi:hypothetical protein
MELNTLWVIFYVDNYIIIIKTMFQNYSIKKKIEKIELFMKKSLKKFVICGIIWLL